MPDLGTFQEHYFKCLPVYLKYSEQTFEESKWIKERLGQQLLSGIPENKPIHILSVGCGKGLKDAAILESLTGRTVRYTAIDPSKEELEKFVQNILKNERFANVDFCALNTSCEEFVGQDPRGTYDLIFFGHVMHFFEDWKTTIHTYRNMLSATGVLVIVHADNDSPVVRARSLFLQEGQDNPDMEDVLEQLGYKYTKESIHYNVDITLLFASEERGDATSKSEEGELLLDFIAFTYKFRERFPESTINQFLETIRRESQVVENRVLVPRPSNAFFIRQ